MPVLVNNAKYQVDRLNVYPANFVRKYQFVHSDNIYRYTRYARHIDLQKSIKLSVIFMTDSVHGSRASIAESRSSAFEQKACDLHVGKSRQS